MGASGCPSQSGQSECPGSMVIRGVRLQAGAGNPCGDDPAIGALFGDRCGSPRRVTGVHACYSSRRRLAARCLSRCRLSGLLPVCAGAPRRNGRHERCECYNLSGTHDALRNLSLVEHLRSAETTGRSSFVRGRHHQAAAQTIDLVGYQDTGAAVGDALAPAATSPARIAGELPSSARTGQGPTRGQDLGAASP